MHKKIDYLDFQHLLLGFHMFNIFHLDPIVISEQADRKSGIVKRAIMIGKSLSTH